MRDRYEFTDETYLALGAAGVDWRDALFVLHDSRPKIRKFIGPFGLYVTARDRGGRWLEIATEESQFQDDNFTVIDGRYLTEEEAAAVDALMGGSNG